MVNELRHIEEIKGNFYVSEIEYIAPATLHEKGKPASNIYQMEGGKLVEHLLISNEPAYINRYNSVFEDIWKNGVDATDRIRDIEQGVDLARYSIFGATNI